MSKNLGLMLDAVLELCDGGTYLCHVCRKKLEMVTSLEAKLAAMQNELESLKEELNLQVQQLTPKSIIIGTKRAALPIICEGHDTDIPSSESLVSSPDINSDSIELQPTPGDCSLSWSPSTPSYMHTSNECSVSGSLSISPFTSTPISNTPKSIAFEHCVLRIAYCVLRCVHARTREFRNNSNLRAREILRFKHHNSARAGSLICLLNQVGKLPIPVI